MTVEESWSRLRGPEAEAIIEGVGELVGELDRPVTAAVGGFYRCGLWRMPLEGGDETEVLKDIGGGGWPDWVLSPEGIYFLKFGKPTDASIEFLEFATGKTHRLWTFEKEPGWGLSLSRDGKSIVYIQNEFEQSNLMLVKNFR